MTTDAARYWEDAHAGEESLNTVGWRGLGRAFNGWMYAVRRRVFRRVVSGHVPLSSSLRVLDIGSGTGFYLDLWRELGLQRIEGSDLSERAVLRLRAAYPDLPIHTLDLGGEASALAGEDYDLVSVMDVLFHITDEGDYARAIRNLGTLVRPGGYLVMSENLLADRVEAVTAQVSRSEAQILSSLRDAKLEVTACAPMFVLLNGPVDATGSWLPRWWTLLTKVVSRSETVGWVAGALLAPIELVAVRLVRRGPSTKLLVCRRADP